MALGLASNVSALNAQNNLSRSNNSLNTSIERLSSGFKINRGADGPAALVISEKQRAQISGLRAAIDNTEKAVAVVQTAEGALNEINSLMVKVRSLAIDSANTGVNDEDALAANQAEIDNALETINRIANNTQFGEKKLLDGSAAGVSGTPSDTDITNVTVASDVEAATLAVDITQAATAATVTAGYTAPSGATEDITINGETITIADGATIAAAADAINLETGTTGVTATVDGTDLVLTSEDVGSASEIIIGADAIGFTAATTNGTDVAGTIGGAAATGVGNLLTGDAGGDAEGISFEVATDATGAQGDIEVTDSALVFQIGANQGQTVRIGIASVAATGLGVGVTDNQFASLDDVNVETAAGAQDTLGVIDAAIDEISNLRGTLGAFQGNTLESTANNLRTTLENTVNAESVIRDTDFAEEISNFTNSQVLVQAGTSVLSSANQSSQLILSLLG